MPLVDYQTLIYRQDCDRINYRNLFINLVRIKRKASLMKHSTSISVWVLLVFLVFAAVAIPMYYVAAQGGNGQLAGSVSAPLAISP